jgi:hypothetical protein
MKAKYVILLLLTSVILMSCETQEERQAREIKKQEMLEKQKQEAIAQQKQEDSIREVNRIKELYGDEVPCLISPYRRNKTYNEFNSTIKNQRAFIQRKLGVLTIKFDFDYKLNDKYVKKYKYDEDYYISGHASSFIEPRSYEIVLYDKNGLSLSYFSTKEMYALDDSHYKYPCRNPRSYNEVKDYIGYTFVKLLPKDNLLRYNISMRDVDFVQAVAFGEDRSE